MTRIRPLILALFAVAACSSNNDVTGPGTGTTLAFDVATIASDAVAEDVDLMAGMDGEIGLLTGSALLVDGIPGRPTVSGCNFSTGRFSCPQRSQQGLTLDRTVTFLDALGATQGAYDAQTTASIHITVRIQGDVTRGNWTGTVDRSRELTITGLAGTETTRTVNGNGTESVSRSRHSGSNGNGTGSGNAARSYDLVGTVAIADVIMPVRGEGVAPWPLSGTITRVITITPTAPEPGPPVSRTVVVTFNGTANVPATINGEAFTLNLAARRAVRRGE
ncbi:MAG: hypothetical protein ABIR59_05770 [Gemmatimonadales bacterium]